MKKLFILILLFNLFTITINKVYAAWDDYNEYDKRKIKLLIESVKGSINLRGAIDILILDNYTNVKPGMEQALKQRDLKVMETVARNKERYQERSKDAEQILKLYYSKLEKRR